jgi:hypothetical protein
MRKKRWIPINNVYITAHHQSRRQQQQWHHLVMKINRVSCYQLVMNPQILLLIWIQICCPKMRQSHSAVKNVKRNVPPKGDCQVTWEHTEELNSVMIADSINILPQLFVILLWFIGFAFVFRFLSDSHSLAQAQSTLFEFFAPSTID